MRDLVGASHQQQCSIYYRQWVALIYMLPASLLSQPLSFFPAPAHSMPVVLPLSQRLSSIGIFS